MTIKLKFIALILLIVSVSGMTLYLNYLNNTQITGIQEEQEGDLQRVMDISSAKEALNTLLLAAVDTIVDKDSGAQDPALKTEIDQSATTLRDRVASLTKAADTNEERKTLGEISAKLDLMLPYVTERLPAAVRARAEEETFAALDDVIDGEGVRIGEMFDQLEIGLIKQYEEGKVAAKAELAQNLEQSEYLLGGSAVIFTVSIIFLAKTLLGSLNRLGQAMQTLAKGQTHVEVPGLQRKDEMGAMAHHVQFFKESLIEQARLREEQEQTKHQAEVDKKQSMRKLADGFEQAVGSIVETVASSAVSMKSFAETLTHTAEDTNHRATSVAASSEQAAANVSTVAAATEELSASISEISRQVADSSRTAQAAVLEARNTNDTVNSMAQAAQKVGEVVQLISEIANQTNLLALNATIEAARAGEAGKGFAVVASEVKNLAAQTGKATEEITAQISGIQSVAGEAVKAIQGISSTIEKINNISTAIAAAVEEQGAATAEISRNVQEAAAGTKDVSSNIGAVTTAASETGQVSGQVLDAASSLEGESNRLKAEVKKFIDQVRIA